MSKVVDITEKLDLEENPKLKVKDMEIEVKADAETVLKLLGLFSSEENETQASLKAYELLFDKEDRKKIADAKISFKDLGTIISSAVSIAIGDASEEEKGEE